MYMLYCYVQLPYNKQQLSLTIIILFTTAPPEAPAGVYVDITSMTASSARVKWSVSTSNNRPVLFYLIEGKTERANKWTSLLDCKN